MVDDPGRSVSGNRDDPVETRLAVVSARSVGVFDRGIKELDAAFSKGFAGGFAGPVGGGCVGRVCDAELRQCSAAAAVRFGKNDADKFAAGKPRDHIGDLVFPDDFFLHGFSPG